MKERSLSAHEATTLQKVLTKNANSLERIASLVERHKQKPQK